MALTNICKCYRLNSYMCVLLKNSLISVLSQKRSVFVELDALDDFTTQLMQKKTDKWENVKIRKLLPLTTQRYTTNEIVLGSQLKEISANELNTIFQNLLDESDQHRISALLEECLVYERIPSDSVLINLLSYFSQMANMEAIYKLQKLCSIANPEYLILNSNLKHYLAEVIWLKGNVSKAIGIFKDVYGENPYLRRRIRLVLKYLISDAVSNCSEAVLVTVVKFTEHLVQNYKDYHPMACLWQACFLSELYTDQQLALDLIKKNDGLWKTMVNQVPYVASVSLKYHKTEPVYRLLELLLRYDMKLQYSIVLVALFDYRFKQGDLGSCCEILNWSTKYKIMLPSIQHEKFLKLLLKCDANETKHKRTTPNYDLKF